MKTFTKNDSIAMTRNWAIKEIVRDLKLIREMISEGKTDIVQLAKRIEVNKFALKALRKSE